VVIHVNPFQGFFNWKGNGFREKSPLLLLNFSNKIESAIFGGFRGTTPQGLNVNSKKEINGHNPERVE